MKKKQNLLPCGPNELKTRELGNLRLVPRDRVSSLEKDTEFVLRLDKLGKSDKNPH